MIETATIDMERALAERPAKGMMLLGLRGVGKTVLLNRLLAIANQSDFQTIKIEAPEGGALPELRNPPPKAALPASRVATTLRS